MEYWSTVRTQNNDRDDEGHSQKTCGRAQCQSYAAGVIVCQVVSQRLQDGTAPPNQKLGPAKLTLSYWLCIGQTESLRPATEMRVVVIDFV